MKKIPKKGWFVWRMVLLTLLFNIIIIGVSHNNQNVIWLLIASIPLFLISIYRAWQTKRFLPYFINSPGNNSRSVAQQSRIKSLSHSIFPDKIAQDDLRVLIGNNQCSQPFNACLLTIGSKRKITYKKPLHQSLNENKHETSLPSKEGILANTVVAEGAVWQIHPGYKWCKTVNGNFNSQAFKMIACMPDVKMIEIKLTSLRHRSIFSDSGFSTFCDPEGLIHFVETLRTLSGGKPVGIRLSIIAKKEFHQICHAIRKTQIIPDFIVVEGAGESVGYSHFGLHFYPEIPLYEALSFVSQTLQVYALEKEIKVIAAGKINSGFEILKLLALGANLVSEIAEFDRDTYGNMNEARLQHWTNDLQNRLMNDFTQIMNANGFRSLNDISLSKFFCRLDVLDSKRHVTRARQILDPGIGKIKYIRKTEKLETKQPGK